MKRNQHNKIFNLNRYTQSSPQTKYKKNHIQHPYIWRLGLSPIQSTMELQTGFPLLFQQFKSLFFKNFLLSWRNKRATFTQLFSSFFFIFLIYAIQQAIEASFDSSTTFQDVFDPKAVTSFPIPPCEDKFFVKLPCYDFVWSGGDSDRVRSIVSRIMVNNPGRPIPPSKVCFRLSSSI